MESSNRNGNDHADPHPCFKFKFLPSSRDYCALVVSQQRLEKTDFEVIGAKSWRTWFNTESKERDVWPIEAHNFFFGWKELCKVQWRLIFLSSKACRTPTCIQRTEQEQNMWLLLRPKKKIVCHK